LIKIQQKDNKMKKQQLLILVGILIFLGGCTLAPKYRQPKAPIPGEWPQNKDIKKIENLPEVTSIPELKWKDFYTDEQLQKVIEIALNNNLDLRLAALNIERARGMYGIQRAELLPTVNAIGSGGKQHIPADLSSSGKSKTTEQYSVNLGINSWEIDFFGRIRSMKKKALEEYLATEEAHNSAQILLVSEVARIFLALAMDRENLELARSTFETQQSIFDIVQKQFKVGIANELDLFRTQTQVEIARGDIARFTQLVAQDQNALNLLAGSPLPENLLTENLSEVTPLKDITPGLPSEVLLNRPDIVQAEHQLKATYAFIGVARSAFFPNISLTTAVGTASADLSGLFKSGSGVWNFSPQVVMPIFDARTWAAFHVSKVDKEIALTQYEKAIQTAFREVADTLVMQSTVVEQLSAQESLVNALSKTYSLSMERYNKGVDSYLSVLDAQRSLYGAQQQLIALRLIKLANQVRLYAVLGGGSK
jgi:outer membrane protein, multidrug efflux system